jgi:RNA polymerase sigma factor (sigma-70 family)
MATITDDWFVAEVLMHEAALTRFLRRRWREAAEIADLRQEVYVRVYEAARTSRPQHPRAFLFATARNLMSDRIRRGRIVSMEAVADFEKSNVLLVEDWTPEHQESSRQELQRLAQALERLPPRCREVIWLRRVKGLSQKEVAAALGIAEGTVEKQVAKGVRLLTDYLRGDEAATNNTAPATTDTAGKTYD